MSATASSLGSPAARAARGRSSSTLAGGYGRHAWRYTARYLLWLASGRELEPVAEEALALQRFRRLGRDMKFAESVDDGLPFSLSEDDLAALMPGAPRRPRFLGYFSRHGVELLLERAGVLAQLRAKGFRALRVELHGRDGPGGTLRVVCEDGGPGSREVLVELRAERSRSAVPGMEVITVDWLLLQNPREPFSDRRPRLPGQQHPGLGLLRDFMGWLVVVCETHGLDGVWFVAAHYHIAMQSRRLVRPLRAGGRGAPAGHGAGARRRCRCPEATAAVESGRLVHADTGAPAGWEPVRDRAAGLRAAEGARVGPRVRRGRRARGAGLAFSPAAATGRSRIRASRTESALQGAPPMSPRPPRATLAIALFALALSPESPRRPASAPRPEPTPTPPPARPASLPTRRAWCSSSPSTRCGPTT